MIYINNNLRISKVDERCLQIERYKVVEKKVNGKKTGELLNRWEWCGFYGDIKSALIGIFRKQLFDTADEELTLKHLIEKIDKAENNILQATNQCVKLT